MCGSVGSKEKTTSTAAEGEKMIFSLTF